MSSTPHPDSTLIDAFGGSSKVASLCKVRPQAVSQWRRGGVPPARRMYLKLLRPDLFGTEGAPAVPALAGEASE